jgi:hypothetical protein
MPLSSLWIHIQENLIWREDPFNSSKKSNSFPPSPVSFLSQLLLFFLIAPLSVYICMYVYLQSLHIRTVHTNSDIYVHTSLSCPYFFSYLAGFHTFFSLPVFLFYWDCLHTFFFLTFYLFLLTQRPCFLFFTFSPFPTEEASLIPFQYV